MGTEVTKPAAIKSIVQRAQAAARLGKGKASDYRIEGERGLWLRVSASGTASWSLVYRKKGSSKLQRYGLGRYPDVTFKTARDAAGKWRGLVGDGEDPRDMIRQRRAQEAAEKGRMTVASFTTSVARCRSACSSAAPASTSSRRSWPTATRPT